jgi:hypothetical protein
MSGSLPIKDAKNHDVLSAHNRSETKFQKLAGEIGRR